MKQVQFQALSMQRPLKGLVCAVILISGCVPQISKNPYVPSSKYAGMGKTAQNHHDNHMPTESSGRIPKRLAQVTGQAVGGNSARASLRPVQYQGDLGADVHVVRSTHRGAPPYKKPLALGDPGVTASLWRESQSGNEPLRDFRAWQAMDLVTIIVTEQSLGRHLANTEVKSKSQYLAAIENLLGLEAQPASWARPADVTSLLKASTQNDFQGQGLTIRQAELTARISAVVAEVLPSGLLRIEGEKILAVNNEEQIMGISGLVRQRDINSNNEVNASQIAQVRIDFYGKGTLGEAQYGGWLSRLLRIIWPF